LVLKEWQSDGRMGLQEGEVIQHSMMTKSIERAQKKVEENNFGVRSVY
jgi:preprotein translocase subunit SecA